MGARKIPVYLAVAGLVVIIITVMLTGYLTLVSLLLIVCSFLGMYIFRVFEVDTIRRLKSLSIASFAGSILGVIIFCLLYPLWRDDLSMNLLLVAAVSIPVSIIILGMITRLMYNRFSKERRYLVIGNPDEFRDIYEEISDKSWGKVKVGEFIGPNGGGRIKLDSLKRIIAQHDGVLVADPLLAEELSRELNELQNNYSILYLSDLAEQMLGRIPVEIAEKFRDHYEQILDNIHIGKWKRISDILLSSLALIVFSPLMLIIAAGVWLTSGRPIIFKQKRVGRNNIPVVMHKFRSMKVDESESRKAGFAGENQHRITKLGRILRRTRLDELPQFFDVLKGGMSVVGPRPEQLEFAEEFKKEIFMYDRRHQVKPGITGWAQINYSYAESVSQTRKKVSYDIYYISKMSLLFDLIIIIKTIEAVLLGRGAK